MSDVSTALEFKDAMHEVDVLCEVQFEIEIPMAIRIRPSHPRYREALREQANLYRPMGVLVSIVKEVDDWGYPEKTTFLQRVRKWLGFSKV